MSLFLFIARAVGRQWEVKKEEEEGTRRRPAEATSVRVLDLARSEPGGLQRGIPRALYD